MTLEPENLYLTILLAFTDSAVMILKLPVMRYTRGRQPFFMWNANLVHFYPFVCQLRVSYALFLWNSGNKLHKYKVTSIANYVRHGLSATNSKHYQLGPARRMR